MNQITAIDNTHPMEYLEKMETKRIYSTFRLIRVTKISELFDPSSAIARMWAGGPGLMPARTERKTS
jgi:hypothetical protein